VRGNCSTGAQLSAAFKQGSKQTMALVLRVLQPRAVSGSLVALALFALLAVERVSMFDGEDRRLLLEKSGPSGLHADKVSQLYWEESEDQKEWRDAQASDRPLVRLQCLLVCIPICVFLFAWYLYTGM